jgi:hypothetical protein
MVRRWTQYAKQGGQEDQGAEKTKRHHHGKIPNFVRLPNLVMRGWTQYTQQDRQEDQSVEQTKRHYQ